MPSFYHYCGTQLECQLKIVQARGPGRCLKGSSLHVCLLVGLMLTSMHAQGVRMIWDLWGDIFFKALAEGTALYLKLALMPGLPDHSWPLVVEQDLSFTSARVLLQKSSEDT